MAICKYSLMYIDEVVNLSSYQLYFKEMFSSSRIPGVSIKMPP